MKTLQLHIPDDLADKVQRLSSNTETFIIGLLQSKVNEMDESTSLADQYEMASKENDSLQKNFSQTDLEGWDDEY